MITLERLLWVIAPAPSDTRAEELYPFMETSFWEFGIDTPLRQSAFIAQTAYETDRYRALEEYASGDDYDTRADLGNTPEVDGDGRLYKGRGIMMLTGARNVGRCSTALCGSSRVLLDNPERLSEDPELAVKSAAWYWADRGLNRYADANDFQGLTQRINGGLNGYQGRMQLFKRATRAYDLWS